MTPKSLALYAMVGIFLVVVFVGKFAEDVIAEASPARIEIVVFNSYRPSIAFEVKCDHREGHWSFRRRYVVEGRRNTTIKIPANSRKCQVWSQIKGF